jgi:hypothetical protein
MPQLDVKPDTAHKLKALSERADKSIDEILDWLLSQYGHALITDTVAEENDSIWTDTELQELLSTGEPLTGKEIVEKHLKSGVIGSWSDMEIEDSVEWLEAQRAKRRKKHQW